MIACSIPLLRPLLEVILRRNPFSSNKGTGSESVPQYYGGNRYTRSSAIELKDCRVKNTRDDFGFPITSDGNSQESILTPDQKPVDTLASPTGLSRAKNQGSIMKTQELEISVSYSTGQADVSGSHHQW